MTEEKRIEVKNLIKTEWNKKTPMEIMEGYIFGAYGDNEHYNVDEMVSARKVLQSDKNAVISEIDSKMAGTFIVKEATDETEAECYVVTTKLALQKSLSSKEWDVADILNEKMDGKTITDFKKDFEVVK